jgi:hypothetical protein
LSLQEAGSIGEDSVGGEGLQLTKMVMRFEFGGAALTAPMMGVQA